MDAIYRICTEGHRTTCLDLLDHNEIEQIIDEYYRTERMRSELTVALPHWGGWVVAEDGGALVAAAGGGLHRRHLLAGASLPRSPRASWAPGAKNRAPTTVPLGSRIAESRSRIRCPVGVTE